MASATTKTKLRDISTASLVQIDSLKAHARWIRDTVDPIIARDGPEAILIEDALYLDKFLNKLMTAAISTQDLRNSRIHLAILDIAGRSTRWPRILVEQAEAVIEAWEGRVGQLANIGTELLGPGGRLDGIATAKDLAADTLLMRWLEHGDKVLPSRARRWGDAGFKPGDWWINALFAFREGMLDSGDPAGGIVNDYNGAYAILMTGDDKIITSSPELFTYQSHSRDVGRYRLTSATRESKQPVRILRSHNLRSPWSPRAGIRYDGLYKVTGWSIRQEADKRSVAYHIHFKRLPSEPPIAAVLDRPTTEEVEDYREYKRLRHTNPKDPQDAFGPAAATGILVREGKLARMGIPVEILLTPDGKQVSSTIQTKSSEDTRSHQPLSRAEILSANAMLS